MPEGSPEAPPLTIFDWFYILGWTAYPLIFFAMFLTAWSVKLFLRTSSVNQIAAFSITAILPTLVGLIGFGADWRKIVAAEGLSGGWDIERFFMALDEITLSPVIGFTESIIFLSLAVTIFMWHKGGSSQASPEFIIKTPE